MIEESEQVHPVGKCTNKYLASLWDARAYARHIQRLRTIKPAIDNRVVDYRHSNAKGHRTMIDQAAEIDRKNKQLLDKLVHIYQRKNETQTEALRRSNPFLEMRVKEMKRIHQDNQMIVNRITSISSQSAYSRERLQQERVENLRHAQRISNFPDRFRQRHPELLPAAQSKVCTRPPSARNSGNGQQPKMTPSRSTFARACREKKEEQTAMKDECGKILVDGSGSAWSEEELVEGRLAVKGLVSDGNGNAVRPSRPFSAASLCLRGGSRRDQADRGSSGASADSASSTPVLRFHPQFASVKPKPPVSRRDNTQKSRVMSKAKNGSTSRACFDNAGKESERL